MSEEVVSKRYAEALYQLAAEHHLVEEIRSELMVVAQVMHDENAFVDILNHPKITLDEKTDIIDKTFHKTKQQVQNLLKLLVQRRRIHLISKIATDFTEKYNDVHGIAVAEVTSVRPLTQDEVENIEVALKVQLNKGKVEVENIINPSLLGGLRIRVGNTIFDGSVSGKLDRLKNKIGV